MKIKEHLYYKDNQVELYLGDSFELLKEMKLRTFDVIFADPPYFLSNGGISCKNGKQVCVDKGERDTTKTIEDKIVYNRKWISLCRDVLTDDGTIWISGTFHNIYSIGVALELEGFSIINNITRVKPNPAPNLACRCFTNSTETILWARKQLTKRKKGKHIFNYDVMKEQNNNKQMKDVWSFGAPKKKEKKYGSHPTQKPEELLERILKASCKQGANVLDPFHGSGTTGVVAKKLGFNYVGIEIDKNYMDISILRIKEVNNG